MQDSGLEATASAGLQDGGEHALSGEGPVQDDDEGC